MALLAASVNLPLATATDALPTTPAVGVKVAVYWV